MHKHIKIGDIYIDLTYQYQDYFSDKIDAYVSEDLNQSYKTMSIETVQTIDMPNRPITFRYKNRYKMASDRDTYIVTMSDKGDLIKHKIYYTHDFQTIRIYLNAKLGVRLAEYEYVLSGMLFFEMALKEGYLPIHASCIHYKDHTFLLSGPSKSGKSTQTEYFMKVYPQAVIINEDKPLIYFKNHRPYVIGSPWSGKHVINTNTERPLNYLFFIHKDENNDIINLNQQEKITQVFKNIHRPGDEDLVDQMMVIVNQIIQHVSIHQFNCINDQSSAKYLLNYMEENQ
jgi:hypothetical protein